MIDNTDLNELLQEAINAFQASKSERKLPSLYACVEAGHFERNWLKNGRSLNGFKLDSNYESYLIDRDSEEYKNGNPREFSVRFFEINAGLQGWLDRANVRYNESVNIDVNNPKIENIMKELMCSEQIKFENYCIKSNPSLCDSVLLKNSTGEYKDQHINFAWKFWKQRALEALETESNILYTISKHGLIENKEQSNSMAEWIARFDQKSDRNDEET